MPVSAPDWLTAKDDNKPSWLAAPVADKPEWLSPAKTAAPSDVLPVSFEHQSPTAPTPTPSFGDAFSEEIANQGGWGTKSIGADIPGNLPAKVLDLGYRGLQGVTAGVNAGLRQLGEPGRQIAGALEALPMVAPELEAGQVFSAGDRVKYVQSLLSNKSKTAEDILKEAGQAGIKLDPEEVASGVQSRDAGVDPVAQAEEAPANAPPFDGPYLSPVDKLGNAIKEAKPLGAEQEALYKADRSEKLKKVGAAAASSSGESGFYNELGQLKGAMSKVQFEDIKDRFTQDDLDQLYDTFKNHEGYKGPYDSINARQGLTKLISGQRPTDSELNLMSQVLPTETIQNILDKNPETKTFMDHASDILNVPRSLMSSYDLSAPMRQGLPLVSTREFWQNFGKMHQMFGSEKTFNAAMDSIRADPNYELMQRAGLETPHISPLNTQQEEQFASNLAEKIPILGKGVKMSDQAYTGFLNKLRADKFNSMINDAKAAGIDVENDDHFLKSVGTFLNSGTGRGNLGETLNSATPLLNAAFFSPRLWKSRFDFLNPVYYYKLHPQVRQEALKRVAGLGGLATSALALAKAGGADVETDPRSSDFAKIKVGNTRYDILGGFQQNLRLAAELATNQRKPIGGGIEQLGGKKGTPTRADLVGRFLRSKESPVASFVHDYLAGSDYSGQPFSLRQEALSRSVPLLLQDIKDAYYDGGAGKAASVAIPGVYGIGTQTYQDKNAVAATKTNIPKPDWAK